MTVKYIGESDPLSLLKGKEYEVISIEKGPGDEDWYRIIDETEEDYLYHFSEFEIIDDSPISAKTFLCPVCGKSEFLAQSVYTSCDVCGWRNDPEQMESRENGGVNRMSLNEARKAWEEGRPIE